MSVKGDARRLRKEGDERERICIIAVCEHEFSGALSNLMGSRTFDECDTIEDIMKARKSFDGVIVCYHGGKGYSKFPSPRLCEVCRAMVGAGANVVLCQHSHCIGSYEKFEGARIQISVFFTLTTKITQVKVVQNSHMLELCVRVLKNSLVCAIIRM